MALTSNIYTPSWSLGWIDFSEKDRQKVMQVMDLMKGEGTVDELGVGVIRNSLSDELFPGITTVMTKAKYFFIVPRIIQSFIKEKPTKITAKEYLRRAENDVMELLARQNNYKDNTGVIGVTVAKENLNRSRNRWRELTRKPSAIYWNGIKSFKLYKNELSLTNLLQHADQQINNSGNYNYVPAEGETGNDRDADFHEPLFSLPDYDAEWLNSLIIELTPEEADFLKHRILDEHGESFLALILKDKTATREFLKSSSFQEMCFMPFIKKMPIINQSIIQTAYSFWEIIKGAHIRFNILLHKRYGCEEYLKHSEQLWEEWTQEMNLFDWSIFDEGLIWQIVKKRSLVKPFTEQFVNQWISHIKSRSIDTSVLDILVEKQEARNKLTRSKLRMNNEERYSSWVGIDRMDYRFGNAKIIIRDIVSQR